jgi:5-methylcytosine-specific restriction endonuclease McrA
MRYSQHLVLPNDPHPQSLAALVLLTKKLAPKPIGYKIWLRYRKWFIKQHLKQHKELRCYYCNKGSLKKQTNVTAQLATLDHIHPTSKGGAKFSSANIVIACSPCNGCKADKDLNEFLKPIV